MPSSDSQRCSRSVAKRFFDVFVSASTLVVLSPLLAIVAFATWFQDYRSPFYIAPRVARGGTVFKMVKFRSMSVGADRTGVDSTSANDPRITRIGSFLRAYKLDELPQLWNVLTGEMSLVGPRPQVLREAATYTNVEKELFEVRPGITDLSSIVFADEGEILKGMADPDSAYNQLIRPWKSRLGLLYISHWSLGLDLKILVFTATALVSRRRALAGVNRALQRLGADERVCRISMRIEPLRPYPPPGSIEIASRGTDV